MAKAKGIRQERSLFYAFIGIVAIIWGYFYVPETKGVSLENIEAFWRKGGHPKDKII